jgi:hypothetical protein
MIDNSELERERLANFYNKEIKVLTDQIEELSIKSRSLTPGALNRQHSIEAKGGPYAAAFAHFDKDITVKGLQTAVDDFSAQLLDKVVKEFG